jgi:hypothetical protein
MRDKLKHIRLVFFILLIILALGLETKAQVPSYVDSLKIVSGSGRPGEVVSISIDLVNTFVVAAFSVRFTYDASALDVNSINLTDRSVMMDIFGADTTNPGALRIFGSSFFLHRIGIGSGDIVEVDFNVLENAEPGVISLEFEDAGYHTYENQLSDTDAVTIIPVMVDGELEILSSTDIDQADILPERVRFLYNYPNPFNNITSISFDQVEYGTTTLEIYNILGSRIKTIDLGVLSPGQHTTSWDGRDYYGEEVASGVYSYALFFENESVLTKKMILLK